MKEYKNFLFVPYSGHTGVQEDVSDGYLTEAQDGNRKIKLPHNNYTLIGIVDECINASYAEEFSAQIVEKDEFGAYLDYGLEEYTYGAALGSFQTLAKMLDLKPTDYILRDDT